MGTWGLSPWVKRDGHEADHSPPTSPEIKKMWIYTSTPPLNLIKSINLIKTCSTLWRDEKYRTCISLAGKPEGKLRIYGRIILKCERMFNYWSCYTMALGLTKHLTEVSTRNLSGGKARPSHKADLTSVYKPII
jgi:hypothetical protein